MPVVRKSLVEMNQAINCTQLYTGTFAGLYRPISTLYKQRIKLRFFRMLLQTEGVQRFCQPFLDAKMAHYASQRIYKGKDLLQHCQC